MQQTLTQSFRSRNRIMFTESSGQNDSVAMILSLIVLLAPLAAPLEMLRAADQYRYMKRESGTRP